jgi:hypothetical protein
MPRRDGRAGSRALTARKNGWTRREFGNGGVGFACGRLTSGCCWFGRDGRGGGSGRPAALILAPVNLVGCVDHAVAVSIGCRAGEDGRAEGGTPDSMTGWAHGSVGVVIPDSKRPLLIRAGLGVRNRLG